MNMLFITFVAFVVALLAVTIRRLRGSGLQTPALLGLLTWVGYATAMGYWGAGRLGSGIPPLPVFLVGPAVGLVLFMARSSFGGRLAGGIPVSVFIGLESFRIVVELFLHQLWLEGLVPRMLTFEGANFDIVIGASAPLVAWLVSTRRIGRRAGIAWSVAGILMLLNVIVRSVLTTPGPTHLITSDLANRAITQFPFTFIPAFLAPLAMLLHVLSIRALTRAEYINPLSSRATVHVEDGAHSPRRI
jgi:uncharacterized membrane protein YhaH (DUF805 family)